MRGELRLPPPVRAGFRFEGLLEHSQQRFGLLPCRRPQLTAWALRSRGRCSCVTLFGFVALRYGGLDAACADNIADGDEQGGHHHDHDGAEGCHKRPVP